MNNGNVQRDEKGRLKKGSVLNPSGPKPGNTQADQFRQMIFSAAMDVINDPERMAKIKDEKLLEFATRWGMKLTVNRKEHKKQVEYKVIHQIPQPEPVESTKVILADICSQAVDNSESLKDETVDKSETIDNKGLRDSENVT